MGHLRSHSVVAALGAATLLLGTPLTADAASRSFRDPADDSRRATDLRKVAVRYHTQLVVTARYPGSSLEGSEMHYWINTDWGDRGPEFKVVVVPNSDSFGILGVDQWTQRRGEAVNCPGFQARANIFGPKPRTWIKVPGSCLGAPKRVAVVTESNNGKSSDWVKQRRQFPAAVSRF